MGTTTADLCAAAISLLEQGEWEQAIALLRQSIERHPTSADLWLELGNARMEGGCVHEAAEAYEPAIAIDGSISGAHANLAMAYREQGRIDAAIAACQRCVALDPGDGEGLGDLGAAAAGTGALRSGPGGDPAGQHAAAIPRPGGADGASVGAAP
jgi:tetratricopeptide (TPR) repeat protein